MGHVRTRATTYSLLRVRVRHHLSVSWCDVDEGMGSAVVHAAPTEAAMADQEASNRSEESAAAERGREKSTAHRRDRYTEWLREQLGESGEGTRGELDAP